MHAGAGQAKTLADHLGSMTEAKAALGFVGEVELRDGFTNSWMAN